MERITEKMLEIRVQRLNELTESPTESYKTGEDGRREAQIGNFHLSHAYGGVCVHRMSNLGGGVSCPLTNCHRPKREVFEELGAFLDGIEFAQRELAA